jgi:hypothetical protein
MTLNYPYQTGPDNYVDEVSANGGTVFFLDQTNIGRAVAHGGGTWRTIYSTVVFGALGEQDSRGALMNAYVHYLLTGMGLAGSGRSAVAPALLGPNPVRAGQPLRLRSSGPGTVGLYDAFGRRVAEWQSGADRTIFGLAAGTYLVRFTGADGAVTRPLTVVP